jgi:hypothetical protein
MYGDLSINVRLYKLLYPKLIFSHQYDFGTTTKLSIRVISEQKSCMKDGSVRVLAGNDRPPLICDYCGKMLATRICTQCQWSGQSWLCELCSPKYEWGIDCLLPVVNSPRTGECGYIG